MKITKHSHSCLLVKEAGKVFLIDPGSYTVEDNSLDINSVEQLDYLLITHEHQDHMFLPLIKEILAKFPNVKIISNDSVVEILKREGITSQVEGDPLVSSEEVPHEPIFMGPSPKNLMFTVAGKLAHPGDSHHFISYTDVLALPVQAPWGDTTRAVNLAKELKPKIIIPIHDWHWNEKARTQMYERLEGFFAPLGIKFIGLQNNVEVEV